MWQRRVVLLEQAAPILDEFVEPLLADAKLFATTSRR